MGKEEVAKGDILDNVRGTCANLWKTFSRSVLHVSCHDPPHRTAADNNNDDSQCTLQRFYVINTDALGGIWIIEQICRINDLLKGEMVMVYDF